MALTPYVRVKTQLMNFKVFFIGVPVYGVVFLLINLIMMLLATTSDIASIISKTEQDIAVNLK
jgi:hypothetical protein